MDVAPRRHDGDGTEADGECRLGAGVGRGAQGMSDCRTVGPSDGQARARTITRLPRLRIHGEWREETAGYDWLRGADRRDVPDPHRLDGDWPGHENHLLSACGGCIGCGVGENNPCPA